MASSMQIHNIDPSRRSSSRKPHVTQSNQDPQQTRLTPINPLLCISTSDIENLSPAQLAEIIRNEVSPIRMPVQVVRPTPTTIVTT